MMKNAVDVIFGGLGYWMFGYAFACGKGRYSNFFIGEIFFTVVIFTVCTIFY